MRSMPCCLNLSVIVVLLCADLVLAQAVLCCLALAPKGSRQAATPVEVTGELKRWHKVTFTLNGPDAQESSGDLNPFMDVALNATLTHENGKIYSIPGYFAADGRAAETGATGGNKWRVHFVPDEVGEWTYAITYCQGKNVAIDAAALAAASPSMLGQGSFSISETDKAGRDFRAHGRLAYVGERYQRFLGSGQYFLKAGPDAPETLLAYSDFDGTIARKKNVPLKTWQPHIRDWREGDPTWRNGLGKGLIGAVNYIAEQGCNTISFLPYNAGGDGDNVWPFVTRDDKLHYDCSKLDQWQIVFDHAVSRGVHLHFKLQENEIDDNRRGQKKNADVVPEALDGGDLGPERKLYCRELVARFGHALALLWNIGEENTQSPEQQRAMIAYLQEIDPYKHHIVIHTFPNQQDKVYPPLLGENSQLTGASLQNSWDVAHQRTLHWIRASQATGRPWVVCNDEQNPASDGVPPDPGFQGHSGIAAAKSNTPYTQHDIRKYCLWGTLMAGGAGVEYYFGYQLPENDLLCEDFRSRESAWRDCRIALQFFHEKQIPFWEMTNADELIGNTQHDNSGYCLAKPGELYLVYLPQFAETLLNLSDVSGTFRVQWLNPRTGELLWGDAVKIEAGQAISIGAPPAAGKEDWLAIVRRD